MVKNPKNPKVKGIIHSSNILKEKPPEIRKINNLQSEGVYSIPRRTGISKQPQVISLYLTDFKNK